MKTKRDLSKIFIMKGITTIFLLTFSGCASITETGIDMSEPVLQRVIKNLMTFRSAKIVKDGIPGMALLISSVVELSPENSELLAITAEAYTAWGLLIEWDDPKYAVELYEMGKHYGLRSLKCSNEDIREGLEDGGHLMTLAAKIEEDDIPGAFWYALSSGLRIMVEMEDPYVLIGLGDVVRILEKVTEIDPSYFFYTPLLFEAAYAAMAGPMLGGGPEKAQEKFKIAFNKTNNGMLLGHVFYARFYAVTMLDEKLFDETLNYVLDTPNDIFPEARLANDIAKQKALWLKEHKNKFF